MAQTRTRKPAASSLNGHVATPAAVYAFVRKTRWVRVPDYDFVQSATDTDAPSVTYEVELWVNYPQRLRERIRTGDVFGDDVAHALGEVVLRHRLIVDGEDAGPWRDFDGSELPLPGDPAFWQAIPLDCAIALIRLVDQEPTNLPNFRLSAKNET
jgi:hypothetical protein